MKEKNNKGITLIALIIIIIVLLILAVVAINAIKGDGIISHAQNAKTEYSGAQKNEQDMLSMYEYELEKSQGRASGTYEEFELNKKYPGLKLGDKVNYVVPTGKTYSGEWRVLGIDNGQVKLMATANISSGAMISVGDTVLGVWDEETNSYKNAENELDKRCAEYLNTAQAVKARSIRVEDIDKITGYDKTKFENSYTKYGDEVTYKIEDGKVKYRVNSGEFKEGESYVTTFKKPLAAEPITEPYTVMSTGYGYNAAKDTELKDKTSNVYKMLFGQYDEHYYTTASSLIKPCAGFAFFGLFLVGSGSVEYDVGTKLWCTADQSVASGCTNSICPVIYLKSDVKLTEIAAGSGEWNIE